MGIEVRVHALQIALDTLQGARRQLDLVEYKKHFPVAVKAASRLRLDHVPKRRLPSGINKLCSAENSGASRLLRRALLSGPLRNLWESTGGR